jgi:hypothetical protein
MSSSLGTNVMADDNLIPGQTYTFTFKLENYFFNPGQQKAQNSLVNYAPDYLGNLMVTQNSGLGPLTNYYAVTFTYAADGSDVASDVAAAMIAAFAAGGDNFSLSAMSMGATGLSASTDVGAIASGAGHAVGDVIGDAVDAATDNVSFDVVLVIVAVVGAAWLLFEFGGVGSLRRKAA